MTTRDGKDVKGFPGSLVPTIEEQTVAERRPRNFGDDGKPILDELDEGHVDAPKEERQEEGSSSVRGAPSIAPSEARVHDGSNQLYGAPANAKADPQTDSEPPYSTANAKDADKSEEAAVPARKLLRQHLNVKVGTKPYTLPVPTPNIDPHGFDDPVSDSFYRDVWMAAASHNVRIFSLSHASKPLLTPTFLFIQTEIFRKVFHCTPDDLVTTWKQYKEFVQHQERLSKSPRQPPSSSTSGHFTRPEPAARVPSEGVTTAAEQGKDATAGPGNDRDPDPDRQNEARNEGRHEAQLEADRKDGNVNGAGVDNDGANRSRSDSGLLSPTAKEPSKPQTRRRPSASSWEHADEDDAAHLKPSPSSASRTTKRPSHISEPLEQWELDEMEELLGELCGHLGEY